MSDLQILTIALAIIVPVSSLIHSNLRVSDAKDAMNKRLDETRDTLRAEIKALDFKLTGEINTLRVELSAQLQAGFERLENALKVHELEHHRS